MDRREFLLDTASKGLGVMALPFMKLPDFLKETRMGVVVHSYGSRWRSKTPSQKYPGFDDAIAMLEHCHKIGAGGIQVIVKDWTPDFAKKMRDRREKLGLYLEGSIGVPKDASDVGRFEQEVVHAKEAGATILRTVATSGGRRYEVFHSLQEVQDFKKNAMSALKLAEPVLRKHKVKLAVENHKDWLAPELVSALKELSSEWIGVTLDFGNSISLIEDPMEVIEALVPYIASTHVKDMGVEEYSDGFLLSEVPLGKGILDLPKIIALCKKHNPNVTFNLEMITRDPLEIPCLKNEYWSVFDGVPASALARTLRMVKQNKYATALPRVSQKTAEERLAEEEENVVKCLAYSRDQLGLV
ncbi:TIM barrel protein [Chryseolinea sp. H1M3-3]|uniref:sugar phosphate isomerase/epimerase family protein n=1 Tax=Chryseolinea sp. H1M3-3 TaxID=3034144 RepID=UPI0023ED1796|nr:TIM barrel protein [Chryseolinea sp. H1M3-3]